MLSKTPAFCLMILLSVATGSAQAPQRSKVATSRPLPRATPAVLNESSLRVEGLESAKALHNLFVGDFASVPLARTSPEFYGIFSLFLEKFSAQCSEFLPADKVPMTESYCSDVRTPVNKYGSRAGIDSCAAYSRRPINGLYADPESERALVGIESASINQSVTSIVAGLASGDNGKSITTVLGAAAQRNQDVKLLLQQNGCGSPAIARLQKNMTRFATGDQPIYISPGTSKPMNASVLQNLDVEGLAGDLIADDAKSWVFNKLDGHIGARLLPARDSLGRPVEVDASYDQRGLVTSGSVRITFADGVPACLYFADDAATCKEPSKHVVSDYVAGTYQKNRFATAGPVPAAPVVHVDHIAEALNNFRNSAEKTMDKQDVPELETAFNEYSAARLANNIDAQHHARQKLSDLDQKYALRCINRKDDSCKSKDDLSRMVDWINAGEAGLK